MGSANNKILFWASFLTLIAAGMGFSIRGEILADWGHDFGFTQTELGLITGQGLAAFGVTIIFFSFFADLVGFGWLMVVAFLLHVLSVVSTLAAPLAFQNYGKDGAYWCLYSGQVCFSLANGTCEAVINPLTATLFPKNKTHWLNILHAGWPGGLVLGALVALGLNWIGGVSWQVKWGIVLAPMLLYGFLMLGRPFPKSEASVSGVSLGTMFATLFAPVLLFLFLMHALIGYVELGTDSWIINITNTVLASKSWALFAFIWTNVLMFTLRFFAGPIVHKISPLGLLFCSAVIGTTGLWLLGMPATSTAWLWLGAVTVYGIGKTFYWPTMLGVISERFPRGGALALGISGGIGMLSAGFLGGPCIGYEQDYVATTQLKQENPGTYDRYKSDEPSAPLPVLPPIAGLDNGKVGVLDDYEAIKTKEREGVSLTSEQKTLQLQKDVELLTQQNRQDPSLQKRLQWWDSVAQPHASTDYPLITEARLFGGKTALTWTAVVPAMMALGFLLLILYFRAKGGYHAEVLVGHKAIDEEFTGGAEGPGEL
jgi:MFS family permease